MINAFRDGTQSGQRYLLTTFARVGSGGQADVLEWEAVQELVDNTLIDETFELESRSRFVSESPQSHRARLQGEVKGALAARSIVLQHTGQSTLAMINKSIVQV